MQYIYAPSVCGKPPCDQGIATQAILKHLIKILGLTPNLCTMISICNAIFSSVPML